MYKRQTAVTFYSKLYGHQISPWFVITGAFMPTLPIFLEMQ